MAQLSDPRVGDGVAVGEVEHPQVWAVVGERGQRGVADLTPAEVEHLQVRAALVRLRVTISARVGVRPGLG